MRRRRGAARRQADRGRRRPGPRTRCDQVHEHAVRWPAARPLPRITLGRI